MTKTKSSYARVNLPKSKPDLNEFIRRRPKLSKLNITQVVLLYQDYMLDNYNELACDQPELHIQDL